MDEQTTGDAPPNEWKWKPLTAPKPRDQYVARCMRCGQAVDILVSHHCADYGTVTIRMVKAVDDRG
jgi:hypothetical protein